VYAEAGSYPVTLRVTGAAGTTQTTSLVEVASATTLVLMSQTGNAFELSLVAVNPNPAGNPPTEQAQAIPQNDVFGFFTFPLLVPQAPGAPLVPEVFVKMLDARPIPGQDFWVFWGGLTSLQYTLTVRDTVRGTIKTYTNPVTANAACLSADTSGFASGTAPTPTPTPPAGGGTTRVVNVGQGGNNFVDVVSGTRNTNVRVGDTVQWTWMGGPHTSTSGECTDGGSDPYGGGVTCDDDGLWNSGSHSGGYQYTRQFTSPGRYKYYCTVHGAAMTGTVVVTAE
jgi:plastocyanin